MDINIQHLLQKYYIAALLIFVLLSFYIILKENKFWKKVTLLVFSMCLLPHVSGNYKLLSLFIPIFLFINSPGYKDEKHDLLYTLLFAFLLIPKNYRFIANLYGGVVIDPIIMILMSVLVIISSSMNKKTQLKLSNKEDGDNK
jgi:hypothetical protein